MLEDFPIGKLSFPTIILNPVLLFSRLSPVIYLPYFTLTKIGIISSDFRLGLFFLSN